MQQPPRRRTLPQWYRAQTKAARIMLGFAPLIAVLVLCTCSVAAYGNSPPRPAQSAQAPAVTTAPVNTPTQAIVVAASATPLVAPTTKPTANPTPKPTPKPVATHPPAPTPTPCASPCNPFGYNFSPGSLIYSPNADFCSYFSCIPNFWNGRGFVNECQDGEYSKSGGIRGDCSDHGGELRALYAH